MERPCARCDRGGRRPGCEDDEGLGAARRLAEFLLGPLSSSDGRLFRTFRNGIAKNTRLSRRLRRRCARPPTSSTSPTGEPRWLEESRRLALAAVELFADEQTRRLLPRAVWDGETLVARKKDFDDHPTPSGNSMLAYVLLRLCAYLRRCGAPAARRRRLPPASCEAAEARAVGVRLDALRARPALLAAARARALRGLRRTRVARAALEAVAAEHRRRLRACGGCAAARGEAAGSTASRRSTCARTSPAGRLPPIRLRSRPRRAPSAHRAPAR